MSSSDKIIAVLGATGQQGGAVVRVLQDRGRFRVRALTRTPNRHTGLADEVVAADLTRPETLARAFEGAYGVFAVTNFWEQGESDEPTQGTAAVHAAKAAGVQHFVWSTLPDVETISRGTIEVPHFTGKARVNAVVQDAGFPGYTFVEAPFYFQNLIAPLAPQPQEDGTRSWVLPIARDARCIHMGDIADFGKVVAGAFEQPDKVGDGKYLSMAAGLLSFDDVITTLRQQGHELGFQQVPGEVFATFFPGAGELAAMLRYFEEYTYMGPDADAKIALANQVATGKLTDFATWARTNMPAANTR